MSLFFSGRSDASARRRGWVDSRVKDCRLTDRRRKEQEPHEKTYSLSPILYSLGENSLTTKEEAEKKRPNRRRWGGGSLSVTCVTHDEGKSWKGERQDRQTSCLHEWEGKKTDHHVTVSVFLRKVQKIIPATLDSFISSFGLLSVRQFWAVKFPSLWQEWGEKKKRWDGHPSPFCLLCFGTRWRTENIHSLCHEKERWLWRRDRGETGKKKRQKTEEWQDTQEEKRREANDIFYSGWSIKFPDRLIRE